MNNDKILSQRSKSMLSATSPLVLHHYSCKKDLFCITNNPTGKINLGTAENHLMDNEVIHKLNSLSLKYEPEDLHYGSVEGSLLLRKAIASYMEDIIRISDVDPEGIIVASGATAILESLSMALFAPNDALIVPAPLYSGFLHDFSTRFQANIVTFDLSSEDQFFLDPQKLSRAVKEHRKQGINIKALLICSPHNPLGITYSQEQLKALVDVAMDLELEIIADEIYAATVYQGRFVSLLEVGKVYREHIHFVYGVAKDFALSGFKTGIFYSENKALINVMKEIVYFYAVSNQTQKTVASIFNDQYWCKEFIQLNQTRLLYAYTKIKFLLENSLGVKIIEAKAGLFVWADFSGYLREKTFEAELELFKHMFHQSGVNITPGQCFKSPSPGWFRICFAQQSENIKEALFRLKKILVKNSKA